MESGDELCGIKPDFKVTITLVGSEGVGKSTFFDQLLKEAKQFSKVSLDSSSATQSKRDRSAFLTISTSGRIILVHLKDYSVDSLNNYMCEGREMFNPLRADAFILVYSLTESAEKSQSSVGGWFEQVLQFCEEHSAPKFALVGCKRNVCFQRVASEEEEIKTEDAETNARAQGHQPETQTQTQKEVKRDTNSSIADDHSCNESSQHNNDTTLTSTASSLKYTTSDTHSTSSMNNASTTITIATTTTTNNNNASSMKASQNKCSEVKAAMNEWCRLHQIQHLQYGLPESDPPQSRIQLLHHLSISCLQEKLVTYPILRRGFLIKQGSFVRNWKRRLFVLNRSGMLIYYSDCTLRNKRGAIDLNKAQGVIESHRELNIILIN
eukprot:m.98275 g.98275  ORF g.98275 m.98275 type:complete len:381 (+) comp12515_c0_seq2:114-1256(+)